MRHRNEANLRQAWADECAGHSGHLVLARVLLAQARPGPALEVLEVLEMLEMLAAGRSNRAVASEPARARELSLIP